MPLIPFDEILAPDKLAEGRVKLNTSLELLRIFVNSLESYLNNLTPEQVGDLIVGGKINPTYLEAFLTSADASIVTFTSTEAGFTSTDVRAALDYLYTTLTTASFSASEISVLDSGNNFAGNNVEAVLIELNDAIEAITVPAGYPATSISIADTDNYYTSANVEGALKEIFEKEPVVSVDAEDVTFSSVHYDSTNVENAFNEIIEEILPTIVVEGGVDESRHGVSDADYYLEGDFESSTDTDTISYFEVEVIPPNGAVFNRLSVLKNSIPDPLTDVTITIERNNGDVSVREIDSHPADEIIFGDIVFKFPKPIFVDRQEVVTIRIDFPPAEEDYVDFSTPGAFERFFNFGSNIWYIYRGFQRPVAFSIGLDNIEDPGALDTLLESKTSWNTRHMPHGTEHISFNGDGYFYFIADRDMSIVKVTERGTGTIDFAILDNGNDAFPILVSTPDEQPLDDDSTFINLLIGDVLRVGLTGCISWKSVALYWRFNINNGSGSIGES